MADPAIAAFRLAADGSLAAAPAAGAIARACDGEVTVLKGALHGDGLHARLVAGILDGVAAMLGAPRRAALERAGLERWHEVIAADETRRLFHALHPVLMPHVVPAARVLARCCGLARGYYICAQHWLRLMVPYDAPAHDHAVFRQYRGHLDVHHPHCDTALGQATNGIVLWAALGRVQAGNAMLLYPWAWSRPLELDGDGYVTRRQKVGRPLAPALDPGDVLVFSNRHLHGSALNVTDETRAAWTIRVSLGPPRYGDKRMAFPHLHPALAAGKLARWAHLPAALAGWR